MYSAMNEICHLVHVWCFPWPVRPAGASIFCWQDAETSEVYRQAKVLNALICLDLIVNLNVTLGSGYKSWLPMNYFTANARRESHVFCSPMLLSPRYQCFLLTHSLLLLFKLCALLEKIHPGCALLSGYINQILSVTKGVGDGVGGCWRGDV